MIHREIIELSGWFADFFTLTITKHGTLERGRFGLQLEKMLAWHGRTMRFLFYAATMVK